SSRAGLRSLIFAYERASAPKLLHMAATTANLIIYKGVYDDLIKIWDRLVEDNLFFDCGASRNAYKHEGKKTLAYGIAEQTGWAVPDVVVAPVAVGEAFIATARGFREMREAGWVVRAPKQLARQKPSCAIISETRLKTEAEPPSRAAVASDFDSLKRLVTERLG